MSNFTTTLIALFFLGCTPLGFAAGPTQAIPAAVGDVNLNAGWEYFETSVTDPGQVTATAATRVDLPHSWNSLDATDAVPGYRRDASWYRKVLVMNRGSKSFRHVLYFEGANMTANVFVNGKKAGGHVGGYLGFEVEITDFLDQGGENEILVRVDNEIDRNLIPSQKADFALFGGLTRDVFLHVRPETYISRLQIDTPQVSAASAEVLASVYVSGNSKRAANHVLDVRLFNAADQLVSEAQLAIKAGAGESMHPLKLPSVEAPLLWSPSAPNLYRLQVTLQTKKGKPVHEASDQLGFRWFEFADNGAFMLNGERLLLRGTHRHEEHAGYGAAMPNELHVRDLEMIKGVGANFVRLGHYPQDPTVYQTADRLGLILWDELPWCRGGIGGDEWKQNTESMLREMIAQNRNHPSVFFWSLGNEIYWLPDFEGGGDEAAINEYLEQLNSIAHELDPGRMTAIRKYYAGWDIVDVFSPSIWAGWYGGGYYQYAEALTEAQARYPRFLHTEYGGSSHVGRHSANPPGGNGMAGGQVSVAEMVNQAGVVSVAKASDWSESYIVDLFDWHLKVSESQPGFAGNAQWAFKDFATPLRPENPLPYINQKGLVDREGRPKEAYWVFKSWWSEDPFCHIYGHSWADRHGTPGEPQEIRVYCNTPTAQLTVNGTALEERTRDLDVFPAGGLVWNVQLSEGMNRLSVAGFSNGEQTASDELEVNFSTADFGKPADVRLTLSPADDGLVRIEAVAIDSKGRQVHDARERVYFQHTNPGSGGQLVTAHGTPDKSDVIEFANGKATILFRPASGGAAAVIEARTQNLKGSYISIPADFWNP